MEEMLQAVNRTESTTEEFERLSNSLNKVTVKAYGTDLVVEKNPDGDIVATGRIYLDSDSNAAIPPGDEVAITISRFYHQRGEKVTVADYYSMTYFQQRFLLLDYNSNQKRQTLAKALETLFKLRDVATNELKTA